VAAIKAKTDLLTYTGGNVHARAEVVADKTGYSLTPAERTAIAVAVEQAILNEGDGNAILEAIVGAIGNSNVDEIALVAAIRADIERNGGMLDLIPTNPLLTNDSRLDRIDVNVSTRLATSSYTAPDNAGVASANTKLDHRPTLAQIEASTVLAKEATVATRATQTSVNAIPTNPLLTSDVRLNNLDATVSSRLATAGYTAPSNAAVAEILKHMKNRWRIAGNQLTIYDNDGTTPLHTFNLRDADGLPTMTNPFERIPV
jgi:hypothetical protein